MSNNALLISDDLARSEPVATKLAQWLQVSSVALPEFSENSDQDALFLLIDIDLSDKNAIERFKRKFGSVPSKKEKIFVTRQKFEAEIVRANALGAAATLPSLFGKTDLNRIMSRYAATPASKTRPDPEISEETAKAVESIRLLNDGFYDALSSNRPLPKEQVIVSCNEIIESLADNSIGSWLSTVRQHDSYTYRHSMTVSGLAVSFAMHLGMRNADVQRIGVGALMHDIGKVKIPLSILDKPGKLSPEERAEIAKHPGYSAEILRNDGQFDDEVIEIALRHHELLDGTGYPDGLTGDQISDPVRIMTIVDIYSALIDKRAYKEAMLAEKAYQILLDMGDKLDRDILKAFDPIAFAVGH